MADLQRKGNDARGARASAGRGRPRGGLDYLTLVPDANEGAVTMLRGLSPAVMRSILDASPDCIKIVEMDGSLSFMNANGQCAMEIDDFCALEGQSWAELWPKENAAIVEGSMAAAREGQATRFEAFCPTAKGSPRWWDVSVAPVFGPDGWVERIVSISRDVTERVEREKQLEAHELELENLALAQARTLEEKEDLLRQKDLLMREVDHRVKNSLAMVTTLLRIQGKTSPSETARGLLMKAAGRVMTIASVHERLYRGSQIGALDFADYLVALCADLKDSLAGENVTVDVDAEPGLVGADDAIALGLVVAELVANAILHAFPDGTGRIKVRFRDAGKAGGRVITVEDDGVGLPQNFDLEHGGGLGMKIVAGHVAKAQGRLEIERPARGVRFIIRF